VARQAMVWSGEAWRRAALVIHGEVIEAEGRCRRGRRSLAAALHRGLSQAALCSGAQVRSAGWAKSGADLDPGSRARCHCNAWECDEAVSGHFATYDASVSA
jgi:hypothetical protein